jgi:hypothetical protein
MPDPNLQAAMEEIKVVLKKYDCAGMVTLASPDYAEFLYEISPSWSCAKVKPLPKGGYEVRINAKRKDYPTKEAHARAINQTAGLFMSFHNMAEKQQNQMLAVMKKLHEAIGEIGYWEKEE